MAKTHDPQQPAQAAAKEAGGLAEAARQVQAIKAASDTAILEALAQKQAAHLQGAPEVALEAELARRGYHYDPDKGVWEK
jgi:hypothetical protein